MMKPHILFSNDLKEITVYIRTVRPKSFSFILVKPKNINKIKRWEVGEFKKIRLKQKS